MSSFFRVRIELMELACNKGPKEVRRDFWHSKFPSTDHEGNDVATAMFSGLAALYPGIRNAAAFSAYVALKQKEKSSHARKPQDCLDFEMDCAKMSQLMQGFYSRFSDPHHHNPHHPALLVSSSWPLIDKNLVRLVAKALQVPYEEIDIDIVETKVHQ